MSRCRLVHVVDSLEPWGTERLLALVARRLPKEKYAQRVVALRAGNDADVSCRDELTAAGIEVEVLDERGYFDFVPGAKAWKLRRFISSDAADVVHLWDDASSRLASLWLTTKRGPAIVRSLRNPQRDALWIERVLERRTLDRAVAIVANDATVRRQRFAAHAARSAAWEAKTSVVPDAYEPSATEHRNEVRARLGVSPETKLIGTAGRLTYDANVRDLLFAGALLKLVHSDFRLVICGDGPALDDLRRFAVLMRIDELTCFTGLTLDPDVVIPELLAYVAPDYWGGPSREIGIALQHGVPVVGVETNIRRAEIDADQYGFFYQEHDQGALTRHLHQWLTDCALHQRMSAAARTRALPSADEVAARYAGIYADALASIRR